MNTQNSKTLVVAYRKWSLIRVEPQGVSFEKRSKHNYFVEDNLLHAISKLPYVRVRDWSKSIGGEGGRSIWKKVDKKHMALPLPSAQK